MFSADQLGHLTRAPANGFFLLEEEVFEVHGPHYTPPAPTGCQLSYISAGGWKGLKFAHDSGDAGLWPAVFSRLLNKGFNLSSLKALLSTHISESASVNPHFGCWSG